MHVAGFVYLSYLCGMKTERWLPTASSCTIDLLRFPIMAMVVYLHFNIAVNGFYLHGVEQFTNYTPWLTAVIRLGSDVFGYIAPPFFFMVSGFFFFYAQDLTPQFYLKQMKRRVFTLLIPYLVWNTIAIMLCLVRMMPSLSFIFHDAGLIQVIFTPLRLLRTYFYANATNGIFVFPQVAANAGIMGAPIIMPLWFVRDLMFCGLLAPIIGWTINHTRGWMLCIMAAIWYYIQTCWGEEAGWPFYVSTALFFFTLGAYFAMRRIDFVAIMSRHTSFIYIYALLAVADWLTPTATINPFIHTAAGATGVTAALAVAHWLHTHFNITASKLLTGSCMIVLAAHTIIMHDLGKLILTLTHWPDTPPFILLFYITIPAITIILCVATYYVLQRFAPTICHLLTGGR